MRITTLRAIWSLLGWLVFFPSGLRAQGWQWVSRPGVTLGSSDCRIYATAPDGAGNTIVAGSFAGTMTLGATTLVSTTTPAGESTTDLFVARLSSTGQWLQAAQAGSDAGDYATAVAVDATGTVTVAGTTNGETVTFGALQLTDTNRRANQFNHEMVVARLSPAGQWVQAVRADGPGGLSPDEVTDMALDAAGNAVLTGYFVGPSLRLGAMVLTKPNPLSNDETGFVAKLSSAGQWTSALALSPDTRPQRLALSSTGEAVIAGTFSGGQAAFGATTLAGAYGFKSAFVARLSPNDSWTQAAKASSATSVNGLALAPSGEVVLTGTFSNRYAEFGSITVQNANTSPYSYSNDLFVARLSAAGNWTQVVSIGNTADDVPRGLVLLPTGDVLVTGEFSGSTLAFGATTLTNQAGPPASYGPPLANGFLAQLTPAGTWARAWLLGSSGPVSVAALTRPSSGSIVVAGFTIGGVNFGSLALAASGPFVAQLSSTALPTQPSAAPSSFALLPNPAHAQVYLTWPSTAAVGSVQLIDALGREVRRQLVPASASSATLEVAGLASGLYIVRCGTATQRLMIE